MSFKLGVIGGGVMAEAIISRLLAQNIYIASEIIISDPALSRRQWWQEKYQVETTTDNQRVLDDSQVLLLAIKPQIFERVVEGLTINPHRHIPLILSILAGTSLSQLERAFASLPIIRVMPNTPALVGQGMSAIAPNGKVSESQLSLALSLFEAIGSVIQVPEYQMDAVTGLSGSGPAFVALMIEALADGGVASGLPRAIALELAVQTVLGTAELVKQKNLHPALLKDQVTSPGGTTIAGVAALEEKGFRSAVISAVKSAYLRSQELSL
ncbi:pyrroline-5-carboxylate reductase [Cyanobacterium aponinum AL20118]|uniref:Pyrroline-5-carboxylate reductase n=2 Tax=Cyanobacterium aponinum TaxID=379064 RepID=A0A844GTU2_9CHRO|nr:pyrroline-5-carboxylate reductase [Cyanobacterium aponinum]MBD2393413.1 pyrroline-5-carboxylate reductase [Cyanobacterium aponinum FACHB-4101]MTF38993.1 pyrroline-5-carboxylate reductase [Cyanobacterium aponinum 0216]WPF89694.1 pyrroline-5-carboxylate reductase [Cyanobacterium aponinum AL20115]WRL38050.1 pyrroline-5-carboxylate reductase [Cyanobacterium aponinum UTEX 3221]